MVQWLNANDRELKCENVVSNSPEFQNKAKKCSSWHSLRLFIFYFDYSHGELWMCLLVTTTNRVSDLSVHSLHQYVSFLNPIDRCPFMSLSLIRNQTAKSPLNPLFSLRSELSVWDFKSEGYFVLTVYPSQ